MKKKFRKSQIALMLIIGLLIFIIVSFVLYIGKTKVKKPIEVPISATQETVFDVQPIKEFISQCVDKQAKDAVVLLGKQGGYLYKSQGGTIIDYPDFEEGRLFVNHKNSKVSYAYKIADIQNLGQYSSKIPEYPWNSFPYMTENVEQQDFNGIFGFIGLPPLTPLHGSHSLQRQIEFYVDNNLAACISSNQLSSQYLLDVGKSATKTTIGTSDISIRTRIPIKITNTATNEITELNDFSATINVRLQSVYLFARKMINQDTRNIKFDIKHSSNNKDSISVGINKDIYRNDDVINIIDLKSSIYGESYKFSFARPNRAPALHYLKNTLLKFPRGYIISDDDILQGSQLEGYDPDEDSLQYSIQALLVNPSLPTILNLERIDFKVEVTDGQLSDYQIIRAEWDDES